MKEFAMIQLRKFESTYMRHTKDRVIGNGLIPKGTYKSAFLDAAQHSGSSLGQTIVLLKSINSI
jgi:hypothetical protein